MLRSFLNKNRRGIVEYLMFETPEELLALQDFEHEQDDRTILPWR